MEQAKQSSVTGWIADLALAKPRARALSTARGYAAGLLDLDYPREALYRDSERAQGMLEGRRGAPEDAAKDIVLDVTNFLVGLSARPAWSFGLAATERTVGALQTGPDGGTWCWEEKGRA